MRNLLFLLITAVLAFAATEASVAQAEPWSPILCPQARLAPDNRFPRGQTIDSFNAATPKWIVATTDQNANATVKVVKDVDRNSLSVSYEFVGKPQYEYVDLENPLTIPSDIQAISFLIKCDSTHLAPALRIMDASGEVHQFRGDEQNNPGWRRVYFLLKDGFSWGGDQNKRMDPPLKIGALVFDRPTAGFVGRGNFEIADLQVIHLDVNALAKPVAPGNNLKFIVRNKRFGNVYRMGETVAIRAEGAPSIKWTISDYFGRTLKSGEGQDKVEAVITPRKPGYYAVRFEVKRGDAIEEAREFSFAVLPSRATAASNGFLGFVTHFGPGAYPLEAMDLLKRYGFARFRDEISWNSVEQEKGKYILPPFAKTYLDHAKTLGMEPLIILDYSNRLYDNGGYPNSPDAIEGFARYSRALASMTKGIVNDYEIWNEWIGGCGMEGKPGDHGPAAYGRLMKAAAAAIREGCPDATIVGVGGEYGGECPNNVAAMFKEAGGQNVDAFSLHPYRYPYPPEMSDLIGDVTRSINAAVKEGAPRHAWTTEIGYPTHLQNNGVDGRAQARLAVRTIAILQSSLTMDKSYWYDFKDDGLELSYNENNFGVVRHQDLNCAPKPAVVAMSVYARMTAAAKPIGIWHDSTLWVARYKIADGMDIQLVWSIVPERKILVSGAKLKAFDTMGNSTAGIPANASEDPIYITGRNVTVKPL